MQSINSATLAVGPFMHVLISEQSDWTEGIGRPSHMHGRVVNP